MGKKETKSSNSIYGVRRERDVEPPGFDSTDRSGVTGERAWREVLPSEREATVREFGRMGRRLSRTDCNNEVEDIEGRRRSEERFHPAKCAGWGGGLSAQAYTFAGAKAEEKTGLGGSK